MNNRDDALTEDELGSIEQRLPQQHRGTDTSATLMAITSPIWLP